MALAEGTQAPDFTLPTDGNGSFSLADQRGAWLVLYFYPKDDTEACTQEACDFRDSMARLHAAGIALAGLSRDTVRKHNKFKEKYELPFPLIADPEHTVCEAYDVWVEKSMYGRKYMSIERTTYIIDPDGIVRRAYPKVKVKGHVDAVLADLVELGALGDMQ